MKREHNSKHKNHNNNNFNDRHPHNNNKKRESLRTEEEKNGAKQNRAKIRNNSNKDLISIIKRIEMPKKMNARHKSPQNNYSRINQDENSNIKLLHNKDINGQQKERNKIKDNKKNNSHISGPIKVIFENNQPKKNIFVIQKNNQPKINNDFITPKQPIINERNKNGNQRNVKTASSEFHLFNFTTPPKIPLINIGNTSFINVTFQNLANIKYILISYLGNKQIIETYAPKMELSYSFTKLLSHLYPCSKRFNKGPYSLEEIYRIIIKLNPSFKGKSTKNVTDFLLYFLDSLHNEDKNCFPVSRGLINFNDDRKREDFKNFEDYSNFLRENGDSNTQIFKIFYWINKKYEECLDCGTQNRNYQYFFTYDLDFEKAFNNTIMNYKNEISIYDCVKFVSEKQNIYNVFCQKCQKKTIFNKISKIYKSSKILILLLRGIENTEITNNKIKIHINRYLDLSDLIESENSYKKYSLYGIIFYDSVNSEYISYSMSPIDQKWYQYIKEEIRPAELKNIINIKDYKIYPVILFYQHN